MCHTPGKVTDGTVVGSEETLISLVVAPLAYKVGMEEGSPGRGFLGN